MDKHVPLVVRTHRPVRQAVIGVIAVLMLALAGWLLFDHGKWRFIYDRIAASEEQREIWELSRATEQENEALRDRIAVLERAAQVDREAGNLTRLHIAELQEQIQSLNEELAFYRGVMASKKREQGLKIDRFWLSEAQDANSYAYTLVLTRFVKDDSKLKVRLSLSLEGRQAGQEKSININDSDVREFEFQHFHKTRGRIQLPQDYEPSRLRLTLTAVGKSKPIHSRLYEWRNLFKSVGS